MGDANAICEDGHLALDVQPIPTATVSIEGDLAAGGTVTVIWWGPAGDGSGRTVERGRTTIAIPTDLVCTEQTTTTQAPTTTGSPTTSTTASTTTTTSMPSTTWAIDTPQTVATTAIVGQGQELPATGGSTPPQIIGGSLALLAGGLLIGIARRRRPA